MKAAIFNQYGKVDVLEIAAIPQLSIKSDEALVKVHVAAINPCASRIIKPYAMMPLFRKIIVSALMVRSVVSAQWQFKLPKFMAQRSVQLPARAIMLFPTNLAWITALIIM
jgi:hypothetical protein